MRPLFLMMQSATAALFLAASPMWFTQGHWALGLITLLIAISALEARMNAPR